MKLSLSWLKQHLDTTATLDEISAKLTAIGLEVEGVADGGKALAPFVVAQVMTAEKHPQADRLKVCSVNTGKETIQVVCGAPNCRAGLKTVLARPGNVMPGTGKPLEKGVIRGVESQGMLCAEDELGLVDEDKPGIIELPDDAPVGAKFASYAGFDDPVLEINLTPNRPDCAGVYGIARDLAAAGLGTLRQIDAQAVAGSEPCPIKVAIETPACSLFAGRVIRNIQNRPSPEWLQRRLKSVGLRPISALVDITNFLTLDFARPLHVFDAKKIKGHLWVRAAKGGETLDALNGKSYTLESGMTAIGDDTGVLSLAGIVGGVGSSCDEATTEVFLESAWFDPARTARTGRALQIVSDARYRFERGVDPASTAPGAEIATRLIVELCGTPQTVVSQLHVTGAEPPAKGAYILPHKACAKRLGVDVPVDEQAAILSKLGFKVASGKDSLSVTPPSWRPDIEGVADLTEEIIRIKGYEHIPATVSSCGFVSSTPLLDTLDKRSSAARRALAAQGLMEAVTWSFMPGAQAALFGGEVDHVLRLQNPISSDLDVMRPSILGNLIAAAQRNAARGFGDAGLFEVGPIFLREKKAGQVLVAAALRAGATPRHWAASSRPVDAFDAKADALAALAAAGAPVASLQVTTDAPVWYHPGRSGALRLGPNVLAYFGEAHPSVLAAYDAIGPMAVCEVFLEAIPQSRATGSAKPLLTLEPLQPLTRDFAFVVENAVTAAKLVKAVKDVDKALIREVNAFDVYQGEHLPQGKKSLALSVTVQPVGKTLTDAEIEALGKRIADSAAKAVGAELRG
ncbi:MAG: phenylalanine--tRNA ligase subunit beta [Bdellovibrionales bacterium]